MTNEEKIIMEHLGKHNPFQVPEGYFESFADQLMEKLPEQQPAQEEKRPALLRKLRPVLLAAACVCIAIFSITLYFLQNRQETTEQAVVAAAAKPAATEEETFMDEAADYVMLDNADIYACLSE
jgi:hypothetical protein